MYELITPVSICVAFFLLTGLAWWALALMIERFHELKHVCWSDQTICEYCIDDRQRSVAKG